MPLVLGDERMKLIGNHAKGFWTKKKILFISLMLVATLGIGVTTAYMWNKDDTKAINFGKAYVDCEVVDSSGAYFVKNTGNVDCYVRATFTVNFVDEAGNLHYTKPVAGTHYTLTNSTSDFWIKGADGYWYYKDPLSPEEKTLRGVVSVVPTTTNVPQGYSVKATVTAEAVQALPGQYDTMTEDPAYMDAWQPTHEQQQVVPTHQIADLKVMTFDIRQSGKEVTDGIDFAADTGDGDWAARREALIDYVLAKDCDLIILQGVSWVQSDWIKKAINNKTQKYRVEHLGYRNFQQYDIHGLMMISNKNKLQLLHYSDATIVPEDIRPVYGEWFSEYMDHTEEFKAGAWVDYYSMGFSLAYKLLDAPQNTPEDAILFVHNLHMDYQKVDRQNAAATEIKNKITDRTAAFPNSIHLVAGNFNSVYSTSSWKEIFDNADLFNCAISNNGETMHNGWTFVEDVPLNAPEYSTIGSNPIDYVFGQSERIRSEGFTVDRESRWGENKQYSYHYPVIGRITCYAPLNEN